MSKTQVDTNSIPYPEHILLLWEQEDTRELTDKEQQVVSDWEDNLSDNQRDYIERWETAINSGPVYFDIPKA